MRKLVAALALSMILTAGGARAAQTPPIKALMLVGGCCHDYKKMPGELMAGVAKTANLKVDIKFLATAADDATLLKNPHFADGYDVVIYDICFGEHWVDGDYDGALATAKRGTPAVFIHCAMHTFRPPRNTKDPHLKEREAIADAKWHALDGMDTRVHDKFGPFSTRKVDADSPIIKLFPDDWKTAGDELYNTVKMMPMATPLLQATSPRSGKVHTVAWTNDYHGARIFGTTLGHNMITGADPAYQRLLADGILWVCHKLGDDGKPLPGYGGSGK